MRYDRQELLDDFKNSTKLLHEKRVGIIGVGGLGGLCSLLLVGAGVTHLKISDSDDIALTNLHRQLLFREDDVGKLKTKITKEQLVSLDKSAYIECFLKITRDNFEDFAQDLDLILDLSDNIETRLLINELCLKHNKDFIHCSVGAYRGILMAYLYSDSKYVDKYGCYQCVCGDISPISVQGILGPCASIMSSNCAMLALQILNGNKEMAGNMYLYDLKQFKIQKMALIKDQGCTCCNK